MIPTNEWKDSLGVLVRVPSQRLSAETQALIDRMCGDPERMRLSLNASIKAHNKAARVAKAKARKDRA